MEEETESGGDCNKGLFKFGIYGISNNGFDIGASGGVVVLSKLCWCQIGEDHTPHNYQQNINVNHSVHKFIQSYQNNTRGKQLQIEI